MHVVHHCGLIGGCSAATQYTELLSPCPGMLTKAWEMIHQQPIFSKLHLLAAMCNNNESGGTKRVPSLRGNISCIKGSRVGSFERFAGQTLSKWSCIQWCIQVLLKCKAIVSKCII